MSNLYSRGRQARVAILIGAGLLLPHAAAMAQEESAAGTFNALNWSTSGFIRLDSAYKTTDRPNIVNQRDNLFNGRTVHRVSFPLAAGLPDTTDDATRNGVPAHQDWNLMQFRLKFDLNVDLTSNMKIYASLRTVVPFAGRRGDSRSSQQALKKGACARRALEEGLRAKAPFQPQEERKR